MNTGVRNGEGRMGRLTTRGGFSNGTALAQLPAMSGTSIVAGFTLIIAGATPACRTVNSGPAATESALGEIQKEHRGAPLVVEALVPLDSEPRGEQVLVDGYVLNVQPNQTLIRQRNTDHLLTVPNASIQAVTVKERGHATALGALLGFGIGFSLGAMRGDAEYAACQAKHCFLDFGQGFDIISTGILYALPASLLSGGLGWALGSEDRYVFGPPAQPSQPQRVDISHQPVRRPYGPRAPVF